MSTIDQSGTFVLGDRAIKRRGYGAMQLAGPGVFGGGFRTSVCVGVPAMIPWSVVTGPVTYEVPVCEKQPTT